MNNSLSVKTYLKSIETPVSLKCDYLIALLPLIICVCIRLNIRAILLFSSAILAVSICDIILKSLNSKRFTLPSLYSIYGTIVFVFTLYPTTSIAIVILGAVLISIFINLLGGEGKCFLFTPLIARVITFSVFPSGIHIPENLPYNDVINGILPKESPFELIIGISDSSLCAASIVAIIMGALYLVLRKTSNFKVCLSYLVTSIVLSFVFPVIEGRGVEAVTYELLSSSMLFIAFFILTDMPSTPKNSGIRYLKGILCAIFTFIFKKAIGTHDCFYIGVIVTDLIIPHISMITDKIKIAKERKNAE